jgi:DNA-binding HxlR family transcriptional regulator
MEEVSRFGLPLLGCVQNRLRGLAEAGLVTKEIQADRYRSVKYSLTAKGAKVAKLVAWLEKAL